MSYILKLRNHSQIRIMKKKYCSLSIANLLLLSKILVYKILEIK